ncbi:unnamed protein product [Gongylonema pulchrum]|uniref:RRM domain-containing protein n=1 Tax=Gongylonema pulchrum TaxID=637853 RepID=A0A183CWZ4_9BILA|nr:unnamed protein product [Gongylonema pulchrum]
MSGIWLRHWNNQSLFDLFINFGVQLAQVRAGESKLSAVHFEEANKALAAGISGHLNLVRCRASLLQLLSR